MILFNDDCLKVMQRLNAENIKVDAIITDPPYGVSFKNNFYDDTKETVFGSVPLWFQQWYELLNDNSYLFLFVGVKTIHCWIKAGIDSGFNFKNIVATRSFNNNATIPKNNFGFQFQPILVFSKGVGKNFNKADFIPTSKDWFKDKRNKNPQPYTYLYPNWIKTEWGFATVKRTIKNLHPNEKNADLIKFFVELVTMPNDTVLDPFMGSGSTGVACGKSKRNFIGIELDKQYFELAQNRLVDYDIIFKADLNDNKNNP